MLFNLFYVLGRFCTELLQRCNGFGFVGMFSVEMKNKEQSAAQIEMSPAEVGRRAERVVPIKKDQGFFRIPRWRYWLRDHLHAAI